MDMFQFDAHKQRKKMYKYKDMATTIKETVEIECGTRDSLLQRAKVQYSQPSIVQRANQIADAFPFHTHVWSKNVVSNLRILIK